MQNLKIGLSQAKDWSGARMHRYRYNTTTPETLNYCVADLQKKKVECDPMLFL